MNMNKRLFKENGMTLPEVSLALMVLVIFASLISLAAKFLQGSLKKSFSLNTEKISWLQNEHTILNSMNKWEQILSQPSITKEQIESLGCKFTPKNKESIWGLPGGSDDNLPKNYKYCIFPTILGESNIEDLIESNANAKPGIYFIYAIPNKVSPTSKPLRKLICRPITFC